MTKRLTMGLDLAHYIWNLYRDIDSNLGLTDEQVRTKTNQLLCVARGLFGEYEIGIDELDSMIEQAKDKIVNARILVKTRKSK